MAETSEGGNNCSDQEIDIGKSAGMETQRAAEPSLLLGEVPQPAHVTRLLAWVLEEGAEAGAEDGGRASLDALFALLFVLAVETGFTPLLSADALSPTPRGDVSAPNLRALSRMPQGWRRAGRPRYVVDFALGADGDLAARLIADPCSDVLIANMVAPEPAGATFSVGLAPGDHVSADGVPRDLAPLARRFKDAVTVPARAAVLNARGVCNPSLLGLPPELHLKLAALLAVADLYHLAAASARLLPLLRDPALWRALVHRRYPSLYKDLEAQEREQEPVDWRQEYKRKRSQQHSRRRLLTHRGTPPPPVWAYPSLSEFNML